MFLDIILKMKKKKNYFNFGKGIWKAKLIESFKFMIKYKIVQVIIKT